MGAHERSEVAEADDLRVIDWRLVEEVPAK